MLAKHTAAGWLTISRTWVARGFLIIALPMQVIALTTMPVFATNHPRCADPPFILPCPSQIRLSPFNPQTAWQLLTFDHLAWVAAGFILAAALSIATTLQHGRALAGVAIIATILWVGGLALFIAQNGPVQSMRHGGWAVCLSIVALTSLLWLVANVLAVLGRRHEQTSAQID